MLALLALIGVALTPFAGVPGDLTALVGPAIGLFDAATGGRHRRLIDPKLFRHERAEACGRFMNAVIALVGDVSLLLSAKPQRIPNVWRLAPMWRALRNLQTDWRRMFDALGDVGLYAEEATFQAAMTVAMVTGEELTALGQASQGKEGTEEVKEGIARASGRIGEALVTFREVARADLGLGDRSEVQRQIERGEDG